MAEETSEAAKVGGFLSTDAEGSKSAASLFSGSMPNPDAEPRWSGSARAGIVSSSGNADNQNISAGILAKYNKKRWLHELGADLYFAENEDEKTAERYKLSYKLKYGINARSYAFNFASYEADKFSNLDMRISNVLGYGRQVLKKEKHTLDTEVGLGARNTEFVNNRADLDEAVAHLALHYKGKLTKTTTLTEDFTIQSGDDNTFTESVTALQVAMTERLSLSLNYTVRNNTDVSAGFEKTDTITSINLVSSF